MTQEAKYPTPRVLTIGQSNLSLERFLNLLRAHSVEVIADTRSYPYSDYAHHFDREPLKEALVEAGFRYVDLGPQLGGRPKGAEFYDSKGRVLYDKVAATRAFLKGLTRLENGIRKYTVAIMCAEENPAACHRRLLVGRMLTEHGFKLEHIRGNGQIQSEAEVVASTTPADIQSELFAGAKTP